ncbi:chloride channel [Mactra antiquata]
MKICSVIWCMAIIMILICSCMGEENRDDWIDPNDLLNFDPSTNTMRKNKLKFEDLKNKDTMVRPEMVEKSSNILDDAEDKKFDEIDQKTDIYKSGKAPANVNKKMQDDVGVEPTDEVEKTNVDSVDDGVDTKGKEPQFCHECLPCKHQDCPPCSLSSLGYDETLTKCLPCDCDQPKECVCEQASLPLLRKYVKSVLQHVGNQRPMDGKEDFVFHITLSDSDIEMLDKFAELGNIKHIHDVHDILGNMVNHVAASRMSRMEKMALWLEHKIGLKLDRLIQFMLIAALASVVLLIEVRLQIAWRRRVSQLIVLMFIISIPWTWYELYKKAEVQQQSVVTKDIPEECRGNDNWLTSLKSIFVIQDNKCQEYHENMLISPFIRVPPTKAIAVTVVRFWVAPLKDIGTGLSEFLQALLVDLPLTLYPIAIGIVALFFFLFLLMWFGYSIRLPFFLSIEPSPVHAVSNTGIQQAIQENRQDNKAQMNKVQALLEDTEKRIFDQFLKIENQQHVAIEYNMSLDSSRHVASPSLSADDLSSRPGDRSNIRSSDVSNTKETKSSPRKVSENVKVGQNHSPQKLPVTEISATSFPPQEKNVTDSVPLDRGDPDNVVRKS